MRVRWEGAFDPTAAQFWWQHGGYMLESGHLLVSCLDEDSTVMFVREYALDEEAETLREFWNFGLEDPDLGREMGDAHPLPSGNTLHNMGSSIRLREVTEDSAVVWDIVWEGSTLGRSTPIKDLYDFAP